MSSPHVFADARILLVDDNPTNLALLHDLLEDAGYHNVTGETNPIAALGWLESNDAELILLDMRMPGVDGLEFLHRMNRIHTGIVPPVVVLTAQTDAPTREQALNLGAMDFATKPFDHHEILQRSHNLIARHRDALAELNRAETLQLRVDERTAELRTQARTEPVTGLPNRRAAFENLDALLRRDEPTAAYFLVVDELDEIARIHGYAVVESLMRDVGNMLTASAATNEGFLGCWGGSEFVLIQPQPRLTAAMNGLGERLLRLLAGEIQVGGLTLNLRVRIGSAHSDDEGNLTAEGVIRAAAMALPIVEGSDRVGRFHPDLRHRLEQRDRLQRAMRRARINGELSLFYQPKVTLDNGRMVGAEALLRWKHPELGQVSPGDFIPLAEQTGDIIDIGNWVLDTALGRLSDWFNHGLIDESFSLAVNVSSRQLMSRHFAGDLIARLEQHAIPAAMLNVEVTESGLMRDLTLARKQLMALIQAGIDVSIDDFGTGYSSLAYLKSLPISVLKIDRSFVKDLHENQQDAEIAQMIVSMAHGLGCIVVAEGVENSAQSERLAGMGCEQAQGYFFNRPQEESALIDLFSEHRLTSR